MVAAVLTTSACGTSGEDDPKASTEASTTPQQEALAAVCEAVYNNEWGEAGDFADKLDEDPPWVASDQDSRYLFSSFRQTVGQVRVRLAPESVGADGYRLKYVATDDVQTAIDVESARLDAIWSTCEHAVPPHNPDAAEDDQAQQRAELATAVRLVYSE